MPTVIDKKATRSKFPGLPNCHICARFLGEEQFRVVEEDGPYDNDWYAVCRDCVSKPIYGQFIKNNCELKPMSHPQNDHYIETTYEYEQEYRHREMSETMKAVERLPFHERQFNKIGEINTLIGDLADAFSGKPLDYQREFSANTRTALANQLMVDELNFQFGRPEIN